jgi:hypothetical protein
MNDIAAEMLASQLADCVVYFDGDDCAGGLIQRAAVAELKRLQAKDYEFQTKAMDSLTDAFLERRWIPVSERLPEPSSSEYEDGVRVLAWSKGNGIDPAWFYRDSEYGDRWSWDSTTKPTHWMPLPEPPTN